MAAAVLAVSLAFVGYLATYLNGLRLAQRQERLSRVNRQLAEFYGPLLALTQSNRRIFEEFSRRHQRPDGRSPFRGEAELTAEESAEWRLWFTAVFMPNIRAVRDVVVGKADLLIEASMPPVLLDLCAHVSGYEIAVEQWRQGDHTRNGSVIAYPAAELHRYAEASFARLKLQQTVLLGAGRRERRTAGTV
ncbi:hypothetical protein ACFFWC_19355 [Plantactinospora siamensis]|uniref:Uncharacterized protein n=1 Tax=Plantactinospora siamensis TaxID=555372 RepID=A0ABV6P3L0_9ACTN